MKKSLQMAVKPLAAAVSLSALYPVAALSQGGALALEEVVVTAQRRETSLQETPIAVTAIGAEQIADMGIYNVSDLTALAPNTNFQKQPSSNSNMSLMIRGVGTGETSLLVDTKTGFYIDGVYVSKSVGGVFDIVDLERVEVLRGPQGTLFGRNSTGGAVNITTKKPSGELGIEVGVSVGNDGYRRLSGRVDTPKIGDMLSAKLSFANQEYDGWATNEYMGETTDLASEDNEAYRIALRLEPIDSLTIDYTYDRTDNTGVPSPFQITAIRDEIYNGITRTPFPFTYLGGALYQQMAATIGDPSKRREEYNLDFVTDEFLEIDGHSLTVQWDVGDAVVKYIFADRETSSGYGGTDLDGGAHVAPDLFYGGGAAVPVPGFHARIDEGTIDMQTHEFQLIGDAMDDRLQYTTGLYFYEEEVFQSNPQTFSLPLAFLGALESTFQDAGFCDGGTCVGTQRLPLPIADFGEQGFTDFYYGQKTESWAAYAQLTYAITEDLEVIGGLRYTEDEREAFVFNETITDPVTRAPLGELRNDEKWDNISYLLTLSYHVNDDINVYFTNSTGYNAGGFNARASTVSSWEALVDEENITAWELGMKSDLFDKRVRANVAVFYNDYTDIQTAQFEAGAGGASSRLVNAGGATIQGLELDIVALISEGLTADLTYGYLDAEYDEYLQRDPATDQSVNIADASTIARAPDHTLNLGLTYAFNPFEWGQLVARVDVNYMDEMVFHPYLNTLDKADDRTLVNARVSLKDIGLGDSGRLRISAWGKNLTDEEYQQWGIDFGSLGFAGNTFGKARTYGVDFIYNYD